MVQLALSSNHQMIFVRNTLRHSSPAQNTSDISVQRTSFMANQARANVSALYEASHGGVGAVAVFHGKRTEVRFRPEADIKAGVKRRRSRPP